LSLCTSLAIDELCELIHLPTYNVHGVPPPKNTQDPERIDSQMSDLTCTPDPSKTSTHREVVGVENAAGNHMAKQLDCTISIASTQNNGIHDILFSQHMTFHRLNHSARKHKRGYINMKVEHWTASTSNDFNHQMLYESSSFHWILGWPMIV
jgi:hypothetical protein